MTPPRHRRSRPAHREPRRTAGGSPPTGGGRKPPLRESEFEEFAVSLAVPTPHSPLPAPRSPLSAPRSPALSLSAPCSPLPALPLSPILQPLHAMSSIVDIHARQILDSRGNPTVEVDVRTGRRLVRPRRGSQRRQHRRPRSLGTARRRCNALSSAKGVTKAVANVNDKIADELIGMDALDQAVHRPADDRARRQREQEESRGQRHPRRVAGRGPRRGRALRPAAVPLPRRRPGRGSCPPR